MSSNLYLTILALFMALLIPFVPHILRLRIIAHQLWDRHDKAEWQSQNFVHLVWSIRLTLVAIVFVTIIAGWFHP